MTLAFYRPTAATRGLAVSALPQLALLQTYIAQTLPASPRLTDAATSLHMSSRSLQRLLQQSQCTFRSLVAECRHQLAKQYLHQPAWSIQQIAIELGFEEQSSFQKAFKHWQGCSPGLYRQRYSQHTHALPAKGAHTASLQVIYGTN